MIQIVPYAPERASDWDAFNRLARNGHFIFDRRFMEYHAHRFTDASVLIQDERGVVALLPANRAGDEIVSHGGLTFGGLIVGERANAALVLSILREVGAHYRGCGAASFTYKAIPSIYHRRPAQDDLYALTRLGARLVRRDLSTSIDLREPGARGSRRMRGIRAAKKAGLRVGTSERWDAFWDVLTATLESRHGVAPTHSLEEMRLLHDRFPEDIQLFAAEDAGEVVAGTVVFQTETVAHAQYIAANASGRANGGLDLVFDSAIAHYSPSKRFFDFGISTTDAGHVLNEGLVRHKEEFGGNSIVHDVYQLSLA